VSNEQSANSKLTDLNNLLAGAGFEVFTRVTMKTLLWNVTPRCPAEFYQRF
jgi:hypothetical protein